MKVFEIDYSRLVVMLLPTFLRKPVMFALLKAMVRPVVSLYDSFKANRAQNIYKVTRTGQVCHLRGMLNDAFDSDLRRIYIGNGAASGWTILYKQALFNATDNQQPLWACSANTATTDALGNKALVFDPDNTGVTALSKQGSIGASGIDFLVMVPMILRGVIDENRIKAQVNYYKLASKRYEIQYF